MTLPPFNLQSTYHLSALFFGGTFKIKVIEPMSDNLGNPLLIKTGVNKGQVKYTSKVQSIHIAGMKLKPLYEWKTKHEGVFSTKEEVLKVLAKRKDTEAGQVASLLLLHRELTKQLATYYVGVINLIYPDNLLHPSFNHVETDTGRLSCKNPNVQNQPKSFESNVRKHFRSRYKNGKLIECDFSQLEIIVQAQLSRDKQYISDVINKVDFHCKRLATKENLDYNFVKNQVDAQVSEWVEKRSKIKAFSFARAYGAGTQKISEMTGLSKEDVQSLISNEDSYYKGLYKYNLLLGEFVKNSCKDGMGYYISPTNRRYTFVLEDTPKWLKDKGIYSTFSPTKIKNYIVQGTATADIVLIMLGKFFRAALPHRDKFLLINTVHDSIILDCQEDYVDFACNLLKEVLNTTSHVLKEEFNWEWEVPIEFEIKIGDSWGDC